MPQEPKKRHSRARQGKRRAHLHGLVRQGILCPNCQSPILQHQVCKKCGYYKGREMLQVTKVKTRKVQ